MTGVSITQLPAKHRGLNTRRAFGNCSLWDDYTSGPGAAAPLIAGMLLAHIFNLISFSCHECTVIVKFYRPVALANIVFAKCLPEHNCVCSKAEYTSPILFGAGISPVCSAVSVECFDGSDVLSCKSYVTWNCIILCRPPSNAGRYHHPLLGLPKGY